MSGEDPFGPFTARMTFRPSIKYTDVFLLVTTVNSDLNHQRSGNGRSSSVSKPHFHHVSARELREFSNVLISPRHALHSSHLHQGTSST